jgi:hypothetical protein
VALDNLCGLLTSFLFPKKPKSALLSIIFGRRIFQELLGIATDLGTDTKEE